MTSMATPKQKAFADAIISGLNPSEAYIEAGYSSNMRPASIKREAQKLLKNPNIAPLIEKGQKEATKAAIEARTWSLELAIERLTSINERAYKHLIKSGFISRDALNAFFNSLDRLNDLSGVNARDLAISAPVFYFDPNEKCECVAIGKETVIIDDIGGYSNGSENEK